MIVEGGGVIEDQSACLTPQRVQFEIFPHRHPSNYKFRPKEFLE